MKKRNTMSALLFLLSALIAATQSIQIAPSAPLPAAEASFCPWGNQKACGDDYQTYPNLCAIQNAGVKFVHYGDCVQTLNASGELETNCPAVLEEVCGKDGVSYGNKCRMEARQIELAYRGPCRPPTTSWTAPQPNPKCDCPLDFSPVCTLSGTTYESNCVLLCNQMIALTMEPCSTQCNCAREYNPVCGADSKTYDNPCLLECVRGTMIGFGECANIIQSCDNCSNVFMPVYSKEGNNYDNLCRLYCDKAQLGGYGKSTNNKAAKEAEIAKKCSQCSKLYLPICGNDGKNYDNECLCTCTGSCEKYSPGLCPDRDPNSAVLIKYPECKSAGKMEVCGVDNKTYDNKCYLEKAKISLQYPGPCRSRDQYNSSLPQNPANFVDQEKIRKAPSYQDSYYSDDRSSKAGNSFDWANLVKKDKNKGDGQWGKKKEASFDDMNSALSWFDNFYAKFKK